MANKKQDQKEKRNAKGGGSVRKRPDGRWEARCTINGKTRSFYADKQNEALKLMRDAQKAVDEQTYVEPSKLTVGQWLDIWLEEYSKPKIKVNSYMTRKIRIEKHIKPALGKLNLQKLDTTHIQKFYNEMLAAGKSASMIGGIHATINTALEKAIKLRYIQYNIAKACTLPKKTKPNILPFTQDQVNKFLSAISDHPLKNLFIVTLFTGMRLGEVLGLPWDAVNFTKEEITIKQQLFPSRPQGSHTRIYPSTKSGKPRTINPAKFIMDILKEIKREQLKDHIALGQAWENEYNLVFVRKTGHYLDRHVVEKNFKKIAAEIGCPNARFHDLRHTYAVLAIQAGDDPKTVQNNLGHATAAFTLEVYAHVTEDMAKKSAERMQLFYNDLQKKA